MSKHHYYIATNEDFTLITSVGKARYEESRKLGFTNSRCQKYKTVQDAIDADIAGAYAEWAFAKVLGEEWQATINTFKAPDHVASNGIHWQVRSTDQDYGRLIIRRDDDKKQDWALMVGDVERGFRFAGAIPGVIVTDGADTSTNEREPCYMLPQSALFSLEDFRYAKAILKRPMTAWGISMTPVEWVEHPVGKRTNIRTILRRVQNEEWAAEDAICTPATIDRPHRLYRNKAAALIESCPYDRA